MLRIEQKCSKIDLEARAPDNNILDQIMELRDAISHLEHVVLRKVDLDCKQCFCFTVFSV
jgi:hypothetical protein